MLSHPTATPRAKHVTIILAPYLTWSDVTPTSTPNLWRMAEKGAVGAVNARSRVRQAGEPASPIEGALALSAGAWAEPDFLARAAYNATETVEGSATAETVYRRVFGSGMDGAQIAYLGLPATQRLNYAASTGAVLGTLGQAVRDGNGLTAAVGNSDSGMVDGQPRLLRPAAVAAGDLRGLVRFGDGLWSAAQALVERAVWGRDRPRAIRDRLREGRSLREGSQGSFAHRARCWGSDPRTTLREPGDGRGTASTVARRAGCA